MLDTAARLLLLIWQGITHPFTLGCFLGCAVGCSIGFLAGRHGSSHLPDVVGKSLKMATRFIKYIALALLIGIFSFVAFHLHRVALHFGGSWICSVWLCAAIGIALAESLFRRRERLEGKLEPPRLRWLVAAGLVVLSSTMAMLIVFIAMLVIMPMANTVPIAGWIASCLIAGLLFPAMEIFPLIYRHSRRLLRRWLWWRLLRRRLSNQRRGGKIGQEYFHPDPPPPKEK
jgi:hypothetical protein